jgi:hypothetical protein
VLTGHAGVHFLRSGQKNTAPSASPKTALGRNRVLTRACLVWTLACCFLQWIA